MQRVLYLGIVCVLISSTAAAAPFETKPLPPRALDGVRAGMSLADAKLTTFKPDPAYRDAAQRQRLIKDAGGGARYYVLVKGEIVSRIGIEAPEAGLVSRLTRMWGKPARGENPASESITSWRATGWRVDLACRERVCRIAYHQELTAAFFGTRVAPPGMLATLRPGAPADELAKLRAGSGELPLGPEDVRAAIETDAEGRLRGILVAGLPVNTPALLERAWGTATRTARGLIWFDPQHGWRARYDDSLQAIELTGYLPARAWLGAGITIAALPAPVLGATRAQLTAKYPLRGDTIALPPIEDGVVATTAKVTFDQGTKRVSQLAIELPFEGPARRDELVKLLEAKWGAARRNGTALVFPAKGIHIIVREVQSSLQLLLKL
jgi:hypothetical protein